MPTPLARVQESEVFGRSKSGERGAHFNPKASLQLTPHPTMIHKEALSPKRAATRAAGVCIRHLPQHPRSRCGRRASSGMSPGSVLEMQPPGPSPGLPNQLLQRREVPTENRDGIQAKPCLGKTSGNVMKWRRSSGSLGGARFGPGQ